VVHGGVRPDAVRLDGDGHPWLVGFGVEADPRADFASLYRAPESAERGYLPKPPADVYALGMTLLATLNGGELPFWVLRDPGRLIRSVPTSDGIRAILARATDWERKNGARRLTESTRSKSSCRSSSRSPRRTAGMPALFTRQSIVPASEAAASRRRGWPSRSARSPA
jgi:hypothetical protein